MFPLIYVFRFFLSLRYSQARSGYDKEEKTMENKKNLQEESTYSIAVILKRGHYRKYGFFRLTLPEIMDKFETWDRNNCQIINAAVVFDNENFIRFKDFDNLCWVIANKDNLLFHYVSD